MYLWASVFVCYSLCQLIVGGHGLSENMIWFCRYTAGVQRCSVEAQRCSKRSSRILKNGLVSSQIKSSAVVPLTINLEQMFLENITCETLLTPVQGEAVNTSSFLFYFHFFVFFFKLLLSWGGTFLSGRWIIPEGDNSRHQWQEQHRRVRDGSEPFTKEIKIIISYLRFSVNEEVIQHVKHDFF